MLHGHVQLKPALKGFRYAIVTEWVYNHAARLRLSKFVDASADRRMLPLHSVPLRILQQTIRVQPRLSPHQDYCYTRMI